MREINMVESNLVILRKIRFSDFSSFYDLTVNPKIFPFIIENGPLSIENAKIRIQKMIESLNPTYLAIESKSNKAFVGYIGIFNLEKDKITISYAISEKEQRKGYCYNAISALIKEVSTEYFGIFARTHLDNTSSQKALEKLGFKYCGIIDWHEEKRKEYYYSLKEKI